MPVLAVPPFLQFEDENGLPLAGGLVYTYVAGTVNTPKATYTDAGGTVQASNPVVLDSAGRATIWIQGSYKFVVTKADGTVVKTTDNVSSFNTISSAADSYYQSFSGDGTNTTFPLSQDLGTDENALLVFVDNGNANLIANGDFATDTIWTKGTGWTISAGTAIATGAISTAISQTAVKPLVQGQLYVLTYSITVTAGTLTPSVGGANGTVRNASGNYTETIIAGATQIVAFTGAGFTGVLDNVTVKAVQGIGNQFIPPTQFTLTSGVTPSITFAIAPQLGTNNINILAPSSLVAAASASAAAAESFANAANVSAVIAANQATSFVGTSTTSTLIAIGSKVFITQTAKNFIVGEWLTIASGANPANFMYGQVTAYNSGTGSLTINITVIGGSGTFADWNIALSGVQGNSGGPVSNGTYGDITVSGGGLTWRINNVPIQVAVSDEATPLTIGTSKITFRMPFAMTLTSVKLSSTTAPTGAALIVDVNLAGVSVFSTRPQIDAGSKTSVGSAVTPVISTSSLTSDGEITIDIDQIGSTIAGTGLKVTLIGTA